MTNNQKRTGWNSRKLYTFGATLIATMLLGMGIGAMISAGPTGFSTVIEPGSMVQDAKFIVFNDGSTYYAKNGRSGEILTNGANAATVINAAIDSLTEDRSWSEKVKLTGQFEITASIELTNYTTLDLEGARVHLTAGSVAAMVTNADQSDGNMNLTVMGGTLRGNQPTQTGSGGYGVYFSHVTDGQILNVRIFEADLDAIQLVYSNRCLIDGCYVERCAEGILLSSGCSDNIVSNNIVTTMMEQDGLEVSGISAQSARNSFIANTVIGPTPGNTGMDIYQNSVDTLVQNNYFINTGGLSVGGASSQWCNNTVVQGNHVTDSTGLATFGIQVHKGSGCIVEGNLIRDMNGTGIIISSSAMRATVSNNRVENVGNVAGGSSGINVAGGSNHTIVGNYVHDTGQICLSVAASDCIVSSNHLSTPGAPSPYPLNINGKRNIVTANHCEGGSRGMLVYGYGNLVEGNDVRNNSLSAKIQTDGYSTIRFNPGYVTENHGNVSITGSVTVVGVSHGLVSAPTLVIVTPVSSGVGDFSVTANVGGITITFENMPGGSTWYFHWYAQTW